MKAEDTHGQLAPLSYNFPDLTRNPGYVPDLSVNPGFTFDVTMGNLLPETQRMTPALSSMPPESLGNTGHATSHVTLPACDASHLHDGSRTDDNHGLLEGPIFEFFHEQDSSLGHLANVARKVLFLLQGFIMPRPEICSLPGLTVSFTMPCHNPSAGSTTCTHQGNDSYTPPQVHYNYTTTSTF